ncbi:MAG TPA: type II toxin-antitoxin system HicB family antitoxin [Phycisphaerae bacterium]|jgi:predicted RNase H-like HicB family nuclease
MTQVTYTVVVEKGRKNYGAYVPDLPGCVAVGDTVDEVLQLIRQAIVLHIRGLREDGDPVPPPTTISRKVRANVAA